MLEQNFIYSILSQGHGVTIEDSDSDMEDLRSLVEKSQSQLILSEDLMSRPTRGLLLDNDCVRTIVHILWSSFLRQILASLWNFLSPFLRKIQTVAFNVCAKTLTFLKTQLFPKTLLSVGNI